MISAGKRWRLYRMGELRSCRYIIVPINIDRLRRRHHVDGSFLRDAIAIILPLVRQSSLACPAAQRRVIGNSEIQTHLQHRYQKALRLPKPQAEYKAQRQRSLNRKIGVARLVAARRPLPRLSGPQCLQRHPKRKTSAPTKACLVFGPVRDLELHLANTMAAGGIVLERHRCWRSVIAVADHLRPRH